MHANHVEHRIAIAQVAAERAHALGNARRLRVGFAGHQRGNRAAEIPAAVGIVGQRQRHQQRAQIGVAKPERTVIVRIARDFLGGIAGVVHQNFLRRDRHVHRVAESLGIKLAVRPEKLQQIQRSQVAGRVVKEHVLRARIRSVDAVGGLAGVPAIDRRIVLHARDRRTARRIRPSSSANRVARYCSQALPSFTLRVHQSRSSSTARMKSSVTRTE